MYEIVRCNSAHDNLVDRTHLHNVLKLFVHVPQSKLTCMKVKNTAITLAVHRQILYAYP